MPYNSTSYYPIYLATDSYMSALGSTSFDPNSWNRTKIYVKYSHIADLTSDEYKIIFDEISQHGDTVNFQLK